MNQVDMEQAIRELVNRAGYRPIKPRRIAQRLGVPRSHLPEVKKVVKKLVARGELRYTGSHLVQPGKVAQPSQQARRGKSTRPTGNEVLGTFRRMEAGYGFVRPTGTAISAGRTEDIYVPARRARDAATGDVVTVRLLKRPGRKVPGPRGEIVRIVTREKHEFVGTYFEQNGCGMVQVDAAHFAQPLLVGDPGARGVRPGDKVVLEMVRFPSPIHQGEGVIIEVLGARGQPGVDTLAIIREFGLREEFAEDVLEEARRQADAFDESVTGNRRDLTGETVVTIDPVDARDFDDAISLEQLDGGHWRLGVHIADVAHFVQPKTALDREARQRATSVYLPDRVLPMLPELISNGLASLQPGKVRYTKTVFIEFTAEGVRTHTEVCSGAIRSDRRLTYEQVDEFVADREPWRGKLDPKAWELLGRMHELAMILRKRRFQRGALALDMPEVKIDLDGDGKVVGVHATENTESHQVIEEFMLAANEAVADLMAGKELVFLRRIHESPSPEKLRSLARFVSELGFNTERLGSRFELQSLLNRVAGTPREPAVHYAVLRSMQQAAYSPVEEGHYALASKCYCHFTSPIRRYPDLTVHRLVEAIIQGETPPGDGDRLLALGEHCSQQERRAESAERELIKIKLLAYLADRVGEEMDAVVTGVESFGLFVQGIKLPAEGLIHVRSLADDTYAFDSVAHTLIGYRSDNAFRLGDAVRVAVARVDIDRRQLDFRLVARLTSPTAAGTGKHAPARRRKVTPKKARKAAPTRRKAKKARKKTTRRKRR